MNLFVFFISTILFLNLPIISNSKFLKTISCRVGGDTPTCSELLEISKFDLTMNARFHNSGCGGDFWDQIHENNPENKVFIYQLGGNAGDDDDSDTVYYLNNVGRWNVDRGHSMGDLNNDNTDLFILDSNSDRIRNSGYPVDWFMDQCDPKWADYLLEATITDIVNMDFAANGIFFDVVQSIPWGAGLQNQVEYTEEQWVDKTNVFIKTMTDELGKLNQYAMFNKGDTRRESVYNAWLALDSMYENSNTEYVPYQFEEGLFAVSYGTGDVQFYNEIEWKRQVDLLNKIKYTKVVAISHSDLDPGESGVDNYGKSLTFKDILWYAMGSIHLGKNGLGNVYWELSFSYNIKEYFPEYEEIDLGKPMEDIYTVIDVNGDNLYYREFEKGYIYVNPTANDITDVELLEDCYMLTQENFIGFNSDNENIVTSIDVISHRSVFVVKKKFDKKRDPVVILRNSLIISGSVIGGLVFMLLIIICLIISIVCSVRKLKKIKNESKGKKLIDVSSNVDDISSKSEIDEDFSSKL